MKKMLVAFRIAIALFVSAFCVISEINEYNRISDARAITRYTKYTEELNEQAEEFDAMTNEILATYYSLD